MPYKNTAAAAAVIESALTVKRVVLAIIAYVTQIHMIRAVNRWFASADSQTWI